MKKKEEIYLCPICDVELSSYIGNVMHPGDEKFGIMLECRNKQCSCQIVEGHGDDMKEAYGVIMHKYAGGYRQEKENSWHRGVYRYSGVYMKRKSKNYIGKMFNDIKGREQLRLLRGLYKMLGKKIRIRGDGGRLKGCRMFNMYLN